jgi:hypothetical protein
MYRHQRDLVPKKLVERPEGDEGDDNRTAKEVSLSAEF